MDAGPSRWSDVSVAAVLFVVMLTAYGANGREIGSYDSRPTALAARELLLRGTTSLNHAVGETPAYTTRWGFLLARDGHYRSVYSPVPSLMAAALAWPFWRARLFDVRAPLAPALIAKASASVLVGLSVALAYLTATSWASRRKAILIAIGLGLGTGFWSSASQTLWQTETGVFGLSLAILALCRMENGRRRWAIAAAVGLALAGTARPQLAPAVAVLLAGTWSRTSTRNALLATAIVGLSALLLGVTNWRWFGDPRGALPLLESVNAGLHRTRQTFLLSGEPYAGLLISPSRGLLIFSPIVLVAAAGLRRSVRAGWRSPLPWFACAAALELLLYGSFAVWWGGHTYGPRYMLDVLPLLVPSAAVAMSVRWRSPFSIAATLALAWSIAVAATGAFCYPNDAWNTDPTDVDRDHARLWSWSDTQFARCWQRGPSPQNFSLFDRAAIRKPER